VKQLIYILLLPVSLFGQYNLVSNPSFEDCQDCPPSYPFLNTIDFPIDPYTVYPFGWTNPNLWSPNIHGLGGTNFVCPDGINVAGFLVYSDPGIDPVQSNNREYIQNELIDTLVFKKLYFVEFLTWREIDFANLCNMASNNLGIRFSDSALFYNTEKNIPLAPHLLYFNNEIIESTHSWKKFSGVYEASGGEKFFTVGNFSTDSLTIGRCEDPNANYYGHTYSLVDMFRVTSLDSIPSGLQISAGLDQSICIGDTVFIGEKISNLPSNWYLLDGTVVDTNTAGVYVHPTVTTTYVVTMTINGVYSTDTVTVTVGCAGIDEPEKPKFSIGPNPNNGQFAINGLLSEGDIISIISTDGIIIKRINVREQAEKLYINVDLSPGIYLLQISTIEGDFCEKIRLE